MHVVDLSIRRKPLLPPHDFEINDEDRIEDRHDDEGDQGGQRQTADLGLAKRLPQGAAVERQGKQGEHRGAHRDENRPNS